MIRLPHWKKRKTWKSFPIPESCEFNAQDKTGIIMGYISVCLNQTIYYDPSLEPSLPAGSNEGSQHVFIKE